MYARNELASIIAYNGWTGRQLAKELKICEKAFYTKMETGKFSIPEVDKIKTLFNLSMDDIGRIFFK